MLTPEGKEGIQVQSKKGKIRFTSFHFGSLTGIKEPFLKDQMYLVINYNNLVQYFHHIEYSVTSNFEHITFQTLRK